MDARSVPCPSRERPVSPGTVTPQSATPLGSNHGQNPGRQLALKRLNSEKRATFAVYSFGRGSRRGHEEVDGDPAAAPALANAISMPTHARALRLGLAY